jgi:hypothetical protein
VDTILSLSQYFSSMPLAHLTQLHMTLLNQCVLGCADKRPKTCLGNTLPVLYHTPVINPAKISHETTPVFEHNEKRQLMRLLYIALLPGASQQASTIKPCWAARAACCVTQAIDASITPTHARALKAAAKGCGGMCISDGSVAFAVYESSHPNLLLLLPPKS